MTTKKTGRGLARAQRRIKESAKSGKLQNIPSQQAALKRLLNPVVKEKTAEAA